MYTDVTRRIIIRKEKHLLNSLILLERKHCESPLQSTQQAEKVWKKRPVGTSIMKKQAIETR